MWETPAAIRAEPPTDYEQVVFWTFTKGSATEEAKVHFLLGANEPVAVKLPLSKEQMNEVSDWAIDRAWSRSAELVSATTFRQIKLLPLLETQNSDFASLPFFQLGQAFEYPDCWARAESGAASPARARRSDAGDAATPPSAASPAASSAAPPGLPPATPKMLQRLASKVAIVG